MPSKTSGLSPGTVASMFSLKIRSPWNEPLAGPGILLGPIDQGGHKLVWIETQGRSLAFFAHSLELTWVGMRVAHVYAKNVSFFGGGAKTRGS